ncbi:MAG: 4Fe-4S dicluster domain-containing protein [Desulfobacteraceae bacterium]|nr:MAG: 4Fe-4S dicluster domain-containing protein [Desulfobacteraceae bacterium]
MESAKKKEKGSLEQDLTDGIRILMEKNKLNVCLECGKCSAVCPMVRIYGEYVHNRGTRSVVERLAFDPEGLADETLWYCLACRECTFFCPSGVDFQNFMMGFRELMISHGHREYAHFCYQCGTYLMPKRQMEALKTTMHDTAELLSECPNCKKNRYGAVLLKLTAKGRSLTMLT